MNQNVLPRPGSLSTRIRARSVLLHPAGALLLAAIALRSAIAHHRGAVRWKARTVARG